MAPIIYSITLEAVQEHSKPDPNAIEVQESEIGPFPFEPITEMAIYQVALSQGDITKHYLKHGQDSGVPAAGSWTDPVVMGVSFIYLLIFVGAIVALVRVMRRRS